MPIRDCEFVRRIRSLRTLFAKVLAMTKRFIAVIALLGVVTPVQAHQIWIEQSEGQNAVIRFGEFGENLREASPGLLDKFAKPTGTLVSAKGEQKSDATKTANGFTLPFKAAPGDGILAEDASYPLYTWKQQGKDTTNWFYPAARFITSFAAQQPKLVLDLVPTGQDGQFKLVLQGAAQGQDQGDAGDGIGLVQGSSHRRAGPREVRYALEGRLRRRSQLQRPQRGRARGRERRREV